MEATTCWPVWQRSELEGAPSIVTPFSRTAAPYLCFFIVKKSRVHMPCPLSEKLPFIPAFITMSDTDVLPRVRAYIISSSWICWLRLWPTFYCNVPPSFLTIVGYALVDDVEPRCWCIWCWVMVCLEVFFLVLSIPSRLESCITTNIVEQHLPCILFGVTKPRGV